MPFKMLRWDTGFSAELPFHAISLARSPEFTPKAADPLFEEIRTRYIDEAARK